MLIRFVLFSSFQLGSALPRRQPFIGRARRDGLSAQFARAGPLRQPTAIAARHAHPTPAPQVAQSAQQSAADAAAGNRDAGPGRTQSAK